MGAREYIEERSVPIPFSGCWMWMLSFGSHGYGNASHRGLVTVAHRISYVAYKGNIPRGMLIQHSCDNRWCVNPDHLSVGTDSTNAKDKQRKGRAAVAYTANDARTVLGMSGSFAEISRRTGVSKDMVARIKNGQSWTHISRDA